MTTVADILDDVQLVLQDNGILWTRDELREWVNDGYRKLCSQSSALRIMRIMDVPGRFTYTVSQEWEDRHTTGTLWKYTFSCLDSAYQAMYLWEAQQVAHASPVNSQYSVTQLWEICYGGTADQHFRFALPKSHEHLHRLAWNDQVMVPVDVRELDWSDIIWFRAPGEPTWWTAGVGRQRSFEIYQIRTDYQQGYELIDYQQGIPRQITGSRTYVTINDPNYPTGNSYGLIRSIQSDNYQYLPQMTQVSDTWCLGVIREWMSSALAITTYESVIPDAYMQEADTPCLVPHQLQKYLRFYTLMMAFGHEGEGKNPPMAEHYNVLWQRGVLLMARLRNLGGRDRVYLRQEITEQVNRPPRVRLPVHYPVVLQ